MKIETQESLNLFAAEIEEKVKAIESEAVKMGDLELIKKENADLKTQLEATEKILQEVKETQKEIFASKSEDEKDNILGKFLLATRKKDYEAIYKMGGKINTNASNDDWKGLDWEMKAAPDLGTPLRGDAVTGSVLVPEVFASEILKLPDDPSALMGKVRTVPMTVRKVNYPAKLTGVTFTWPTNETTAKTEKNPTFNEVELEAKTAAGWIAFTEELTEDSVVGLGAYFAELFKEAWQTEFDEQCLNANATPFTGVLNASGTNAVIMGSGKTSFYDATLDDVVDLISALNTKAKRKGGNLIMHQTTLDYFKKVKNDVGDYVYAQPAGNQPGTLWGYPVILSDVMPDSADDAVSTGFMIFGNPKHIIHGNRIGMEIKLFDQTADTLVYDRLFIRARIRQGFHCAIPSAFAILKTAAS